MSIYQLQPSNEFKQQIQQPRDFICLFRRPHLLPPGIFPLPPVSPTVSKVCWEGQGCACPASRRPSCPACQPPGLCLGKLGCVKASQKQVALAGSEARQRHRKPFPGAPVWGQHGRRDSRQSVAPGRQHSAQMEAWQPAATGVSRLRFKAGPRLPQGHPASLLLGQGSRLGCSCQHPISV